MTNDIGFPLIKSHLPKMMAFVSGLTQDYRSGDIQSWEMMAYSIDIVEEWPQVAPLTEIEIRQYLNIGLFPLLKMMMLAAN